jgi:hypothetical protein
MEEKLLQQDPNKKTVLDPFGTSIIADYERLYKEFGIEPFKPFLSKVPNPSLYMRRGVVF